MMASFLLRSAFVRATPACNSLRGITNSRAAQAVRMMPCASASTTAKSPHYTTIPKGTPETLEYRISHMLDDTLVSAWHDIPLFAGDGLVNFICEIPKETSAKMELATKEVRNPIKQDVKKGNIRFYPYNINWNYGMLPQTWEDPDHPNPDCFNAGGDNDPVDVVEIGSTQLAMGGVYKVKPLGIFALVDDGEVDWKVVTIRADDPKAASVNDVEDVEREFPGELKRIVEWFRDYKLPDGKPPNQFGYDSKCLNKEFALEVITETHEFYNKLKSGARPNTEDLSLI